MASCTKKKGAWLDNGVPVRNGLVAEYRFNEGSGQVLTDYSGNGNHGTLGSAAGADANDPTWTAQGASFTTNQYISATALAGLTDHAKRSVFVVLIPTTLAVNAGIFGKYTATGNQRCWLIRVDPAVTSRFNVVISDSGVYTGHAKDYQSPAGTIANGAPASIGFTFDTGVLNLYNGGTLLTPVKATDDAITTIFTSANVAEFGRHDGANYYLEGVICYAVVYNRCLVQSEISRNYAFLKSYFLKNRGITLP